MMNIAKSGLVGLWLVSLGISAQGSEHPDPYQDKALELLQTSVALRTADGFGLVPELASYLAGEMRQAGFEPEDIHLLPMGKTAALVVRYPGDGSSSKKAHSAFGAYGCSGCITAGLGAGSVHTDRGKRLLLWPWLQ